MWKTRITLVGALLAVLLVLLILTHWSSTPSVVPRFVASRSQPVGPFRYMQYDWGGAVPVRDGKVWIDAQGNLTNSLIRQFLYDLERRQPIGELFNAGPVFANADQTKLLCEGYGSPGTAFKWKLVRWLRRFKFGQALAQRMNYSESFWILDLTNNQAIRVGEVSQAAGAGSRFVPAPGFRYGYNRPSTSFGTGQIFICDLQSNLFTRVTIDGDPEGWWNDHTILFKDSLHNLKLFDVATHATSTLLTAEAISASLQELGLSPKAAALAVLCHWNGRDYDVLLTEDKEKNWGDSFLVRAERGESKVVLKLISRAFKFQWGGHFNAERTLYLYEGENGPPGRGGNGAVFIRDMADGSSRTVVPPDNGGQYSLPRFGGEGVIYWRKRLLWQVDLNGSNNVPLLTQPSQ